MLLTVFTVHRSQRFIRSSAFVFFIAGFETASTTLSFILYELSINKELQDRARQEIHTVLEKHDGQFTYEAMMSMNYIGQVIHGENCDPAHTKRPTPNRNVYSPNRVAAKISAW